ncbi:MAG TPA: patatin-like phospholipase family protein [Pyrinomonadaceae bacterium]|jgi:predicted acylesterase/phospholipase RssA|nr:patatin-like phospholipase family protein [Pyrinomonadaceae bacterium]
MTMPENPTQQNGSPDQNEIPLGAARIVGCFSLTILLAIVWLVICSLRDEGFGGTLELILKIFFPISILIFLARTAHQIGFWIVSPILVCIFWLREVGSYSRTRDALSLGICFGAVFIIALLLSAVLRGKKETFIFLKGVRGFLFAVMVVLSFWVVASLVDHSIESKRDVNTLNPARFSTLQANSDWRGISVGLALSGGGYRAAVMHAGVLNALETVHVPVRVISTVSGGSIIGSYYCAGGSPEHFRDVMSTQRFNLFRELTDFHNVVRLITPFQIPATNIRLLPFGEFDRTDLQAELLDRVLLKSFTFSQLEQANGPRLIIGATDLYNGASVGISAQGVFIKRLIRPNEKDQFINVKNEGSSSSPTFHDLSKSMFFDVQTKFDDELWPKRLLDTRVSTMVAASGAFPLAFNSKSWQPLSTLDLLLTDGGVTDNSGVNLILNADETNHPGWHVDVILSSDASALFEGARQIEPLLQVTRAIDVVYANTGVRLYQNESNRRPTFLLSPVIFFSQHGSSHLEALSAAEDPEKLWTFLDNYFDDKRASAFSETADLGLLVSSLPESDDKAEALRALDHMKTGSFGEAKLTTLTGRMVQQELAKLERLDAQWKAKFTAEGPPKTKLEEVRRKRDQLRYQLLVLAELKVQRETLAKLRDDEIVGKFWNLLGDDLKNCVEVFRHTSTLDDRLSPESVNSLYRLGQYLVVLNWPSIRKQLESHPAQAKLSQ